MAFDAQPTPSARQAAVPRRRILLCYDGSAEAKHALERVGEIASVVPSRVTVVSVADPIYAEPPYAGFADPGEEQIHRHLLEDGGPARPRSRRHDGRAGRPPGRRHPRRRTRRRRPRRGRLRPARIDQTLLFGSVSAEVVVEAPCDVLVVR